MNNPFSVDSYVDGYLDRRMKFIIEEWDLARKGDVGDFSNRVEALDREIGSMKDFEEAANVRIDQLEVRLKQIKEAKR